jgi:NADP-dependent 3-hydroxy acid dehydrogenase YdfG
MKLVSRSKCKTLSRTCNVQHIAYEFALRGANLVLAARRTERLERVCENCYLLGSKDVLIADVQKEKDCKNIIDRAVDRFGTGKTFIRAGVDFDIRVGHL